MRQRRVDLPNYNLTQELLLIKPSSQLNNQSIHIIAKNVKTYKNYTHPSSTLRAAIGERNPPTKTEAVDENGAEEFCNELGKDRKNLSNP